MAYAWTHDPALADDLVQQTCYQALRKQRHLRDPEAADAWLFRILANCLSDYYRSHKKTVSDEGLQLVESRTPDRVTQEEQVAERVRKAIRALPLAHRQVITLVDLEGFSYAAVAQVLDIPVGTVMSRLSRGRGALREKLLEGSARDSTDLGSKVRQIR